MNVFELVEQHVPIQEVIQEYVPLKQKGGHYYGLCPFHNDTKLGSFCVTPSKKFFKCFSCGTHGDVIEFVAEHLGIARKEAAVRLALQYNLITTEEAERIRGGSSQVAVESKKATVQEPDVDNRKLSDKRDAKYTNDIYRAFVNAAEACAELPEEFRNHLLEYRKIRPEDLGNYFVFPSPRDACFWEHFRMELESKTGIKDHREQNEAVLGVPGFYRNANGKTTFMWSKKASMGIVVKDRNGLISGIQLRVMEELDEGEQRYRFLSSGFADGEASGYTHGCGCGFVEDIVYPKTKQGWLGIVAVTEGRFKAEALAKLGFMAVNMHSISNWNAASEVVNALAEQYDPKFVLLAYDQEDNPNTMKSADKLASKLNYPVNVAVWDKNLGKGFDDVVNAGQKDKIMIGPWIGPIALKTKENQKESQEDEGKSKGDKNMTTSTNNNKPFLTCAAGKDTKGTLYAIHMEGNVARDIRFMEANGSKKALASFSMGIGKNVWSLFGEDVEKSHPETTFINVTAFDKVAENMNRDLVKGSKIVVCGKITEEEFQKRDGSTGVSAQIIVDSYYPLSCKASKGGAVGSNVAHSNQSYTNRNGQTAELSVGCLIAGKIKKVDELKNVNNRDVISFDLELGLSAEKMAAIVLGKYDKSKSYGDYRTLRCSIWGQRAAKVGKILTVGNDLVVTGVPAEKEHNGNIYVNMNVQEFSVMNWQNSNNNSNNNQTSNSGNNSAPAQQEMPPQAPIDDMDFNYDSLLDDLDDNDLPF